jgi:hypothetical protein
MVLKISDLNDKNKLAEVAAGAAMFSGDFKRMTELKAEIFGLKRIRDDLRAKQEAALPSGRKKGREPGVFERVVSQMRSDMGKGIDVGNMKQEAMALRYSASRDTCERALQRIIYPQHSE